MTNTYWTAAVASWSLAMVDADLSPNTIRTRTEHITMLGRAHPDSSPWALTATDLVAWTGGRSWSTEYRRSVRASLRSFYRHGVRAGHVEVSPAEGLPKIAPAQPRPRPASDLAYRLALASAPARERLMLRLAAEVGLRRAEVAVIHSGDLFEDLGGWSLVVHGKGRKDRFVPLPAGISAELRALGQGYAFPGRDGGHLSPRWVGTVIARLLPNGTTMHALRHRFATRAYTATKDIRAVQELLGHTNVGTTQRYVAVENDTLRAVVLAAA